MADDEAQLLAAVRAIKIESPALTAKEVCEQLQHSDFAAVKKACNKVSKALAKEPAPTAPAAPAAPAPPSARKERKAKAATRGAQAAPAPYSQEFWDERYGSTQRQEWLLVWEDVREALQPWVKPSDRILVVGCGNSAFSKEMHDSGFHNMLSTDLNRAVVDAMAARHPEMEWKVDDATASSLEDESFDMIIEKSVVDNLAQNGTDAAVADDAIASFWLETWRLLKPGGRYVCLNFTRRERLLDSWFTSWGVQVGVALGCAPWKVTPLDCTPSMIPHSDVAEGVRHSTFVAVKSGPSIEELEARKAQQAVEEVPTGTAEAFGNELMREARRRGYNAKSVDLEEYEPEQLAEEKAPTVFLMATHGEGEPTDNAVDFYKWMNDDARKGQQELADVTFAVFALGNTQYEHYCYMGKWAQEKLVEYGARSVMDLGMGNDDEDLRADFEAWQEKLWPALAKATGGGSDEAGGAAGGKGSDAGAPTMAFEARFLPSSVQPSSDLDWLGLAFPKLSLYECRVATEKELTSDTSYDSGSVKHIELTCQGSSPGGQEATLEYEAADDLGVCCDNGPALAAATASRLGLDPRASFELLPLPTSEGIAAPLPTPCTVEQALRYHVDVRAPLKKEVLLCLAAHAADAAHATALKALGAKHPAAGSNGAPAGANGTAASDYSSYIQRDGRGLLEVLHDFPSCHPPFAALLELIPKLTPRYYTISSSPKSDGGKTVHVTVKVVREAMRGNPSRVKEGICSTQLGDLTASATATVFVRASAFRLPKNPKAPIIMIGPGTGVAPFRAMTQELVADAKTATGARRRTGESRLYFGCRREHIDFLYRAEFDEAEASGTLTSLRTAFSRDNPEGSKVYVQQRILEDGPRLYALLSEGILPHARAHVYICGGTGMGREVVAALTQVYVQHGGKSEAEAAAAIRQLTAEGRLVQELWA